MQPMPKVNALSVPASETAEPPDIAGDEDMPQAVIEVAEKVSKEDALALVTAYYQQRIGQKQKEIEGLKRENQSLLQIVSDKMLLSASVGSRSGRKNRPTAAQMANRNKVVAMAASEFKLEHGRLASVDEIASETKYTRQQIYATNAYKEGKIAKRSAKLTTDVTGSSIRNSQQFSIESIERSRTNRRSRTEQDELDALIDQQEEDDQSRFVK